MQETVQVPVQNLTAVEIGGAVVLAMFVVDKIMGWVFKFRAKDEKSQNGNGVGKVLGESMSKMAAEFEVFQGGVQKAHDKQCQGLENQTLVLDRIYQGQALQIKALDKIVEKLS